MCIQILYMLLSVSGALSLLLAADISLHYHYQIEVTELQEICKPCTHPLSKWLLTDGSHSFQHYRMEVEDIIGSVV